MAWSTREIAELSGTTVKTVRYYHEIGLLDEPGRKSNGYKQYEIHHLLQLLRIKRLTELGVPLARVAEMEADPDGQAPVFQVIDAELAATVERLQNIRRELAVLSSPGARPDVPPGFTGVTGNLRDNDRKLLMIFAQLFSDESMEAVHRILGDHPNDGLDEEFRDLPEDDDEATRQALAERLAPLMTPASAANPVSLDPRGPADAARAAAGHALEALYHRAQLDVLRRAHRISAGTVPSYGAARPGTRHTG